MKKAILLTTVGTMVTSIAPISVFAADISSELPKYELSQAELPELPKLEKPTLSMEYERPENFPDINTDLSSKYESLMGELSDNGFGKNNYENGLPKLEISNKYSTAEDYFKDVFKTSIKDRPIASEWSSQGVKDRLSKEELSNYLKTAEEKYLPQITAAKEASSKIDYTPIDLSSKFSLMSYEEAKKTNSSLPDYNTLKNSLQSTATLKPLPTLQYTAPSEFNEVKNKVQNSQSTPFTNITLPNGVTMNSSGQLIDNRDSSSNAANAMNAMKETIVDMTNSKKQDNFDKALEKMLKEQKTEKKVSSMDDVKKDMSDIANNSLGKKLRENVKGSVSNWWGDTKINPKNWGNKK